MNTESDRRLRSPAWAASLLLHALLLVVLLWTVNARTPQGAAEASLREVGIVLRQESRDSVLLETFDEAPLETTQSEQAQDIDLSHALPETGQASPFADLLTKLTAAGPAPSDTRGQSQGQGGGKPRLPIGQARTSVFGVEGTGSRFVYVFDRSISMRGAALRAAKQELLTSLVPLEETHQFQILFFNHRVSAFDLMGGQNRIAFATEQTKRLANDFVTGVTADGSTDRYGALSRALRLRPDVVFFLTDADTPMSPSEMQKIAKLNERTGAMICTIEFGIGPQREKQNFLVQLASQTGGQHGYVDTNLLAR